jgi:hypothetical protein
VRRLLRARASLAASLLGLLLLAGCATSRGVVAAPELTSANPESGPAVKIVRVTDARKFEVAPPDPSTPSLKGGEIGDAAITSRAIARKRNSFGQALGDILLQEGDTVAELTGDALKKGLRGGGFRVLESGDPGWDQAIPLEVDIDKLWMWFSPGFWAIHIEFAALVRVKGGIVPFDDGKEFTGYVRVGAQASTEKQWMKTLSLGLEDLQSNVSRTLRGEPPAAAEEPAKKP